MLQPKISLGVRALERSLGRCLYELATESRLVRAGLKDTSEIASIMERWAGLYQPDIVQLVRTAYQRAAEPDARERLRRLYLALLDGAIERPIAAMRDKLTERLLRSNVDIDGEVLNFYGLHPRISKEPNPDKREKLFDALGQVQAETNPARQEILAATLTELNRFGYTDYVGYCAEVKQIDYARLSESLRRLTSLTADTYFDLYGEMVQKAVGRAWPGLSQCHGWYFSSLSQHDTAFASDQLIPSAWATLRDMGIDPDSLDNVHIDAEERDKKNPRASCYDANPPHEVHLLVRPTGGWSDYSSFFHELGHALHFGLTSARLPFAYRRLATSNGLTETHAYLLQSLVRSSHWMTDHLGIPTELAGEISRKTWLVDLALLRRYLGKLEYELGLYGGPLDASENAAAYVRILGRLTGYTYPGESYLYDVDPWLYVADYLRAWVAEAQLSDYLSQEYGPRWYRDPRAGRLLRGLWREGVKKDAEGMLSELGYTPFDVGPLVNRYRSL